MSAFKNIGVKEYFKRYGIKNALVRGIFTAFPVHFVFDYENKKILYYHKVYKWLKKKYLSAASIEPEGLEYGAVSFDNPIWIYWKQGVDNAPPIVKKCIASVKHYSAQEVIILTDKNYREYIKFPHYIMNRIKNGNMSTAAFSDLLRFSLLAHYGGTWIDATVMFTDKLPEYVTEGEIFAFHDSFGLIQNPAELSVWLLHGNKGNSLFIKTRNIVYEYWKRESYVIEYLLPNIILTMVYEENPEYMSYVNSDYCRLLFKEFDKDFSQKTYKHITDLTSIHKLSYKLDADLFKEKSTFYHYLMETDQ